MIAASAQDRVDEIRSMQQPEGEGDEELTSEAWSKVIRRERQSVLQLAEPPLPVSRRVTEHVAQRDSIEHEA